MRTRLTAAALAAAAALTLAACNSDASPGNSKGTSAPATAAGTPSTTSSADRSALDRALGIPPVPAGKAKTELFSTLDAIRPGLTHNQAATLDDVRNQCQTINTGGKALDQSAAARFGVTAAEGTRIVTALKASGVCKVP